MVGGWGFTCSHLSTVGFADVIFPRVIFGYPAPSFVGPNYHSPTWMIEIQWPFCSCRCLQGRDWWKKGRFAKILVLKNEAFCGQLSHWLDPSLSTQVLPLGAPLSTSKLRSEEKRFETAAHAHDLERSDVV